MNSAMTIESMDALLGHTHVPAFLSSRPNKSARELSGTANEVLSGMMFAIEQMLMNTLQKRTSEEFDVAYNEYFPKYAAVMLALSRFADAIIPTDVVQRLTWESYCEREADFRDAGAAAFGAEIRSQALFTVWTMRKINELITQMRSVKRSESAMTEEERECCQQYVVNALRANFSLDCLSLALRDKSSIFPEVQNELTDGLRAVVNAYAWVRRGAALHFPDQEQPVAPIEWDNEDEQFLTSSMADFAVEEY
jgi:hypothetical protein